SWRSRESFVRGRTGMRVSIALIGFVAVVACSKEMAPPPNENPNPQPPTPIAFSGQALYHSLRCANCHGSDGRASDLFPGAPTLIGRTADDIKVSVVTPCANPNSTANCHPLKIADLTQEQLDALAAYLLELGGGKTAENPGPPCDTVSGNICTVVGVGVA